MFTIMRKLMCVISVVALSLSGIRAQEFMTLNPDVRTAGMANASAAMSGGAFSVYGNAAAALFDYKRVQFGFSYAPVNSGDAQGDYYAVGGYYSLNEKHTLALGMRIHNSPLTTVGMISSNPVGTPDLSGGDVQTSYTVRPLGMSVDAAYALMVHEYAGLSLTAKYMHQSTAFRQNYSAMSFDLAAYVQIPLDRMLDGAWIAAGAKVADAGFAFGDKGCRLPLRADIGATLYAPFGDSHEVSGTVDFGYGRISDDRKSFGMAVGAEYTFMQLLSVRAGYHAADKCGFDYGSIGAGIRFMILQADFAYMIARKDSPFRNMYGISVGINF